MPRAPRLAMVMLPGLDHFTADLLARLPAASGWDVRKFLVTGAASFAGALAWTDEPSRDAVWFEFCWPPFPAMIGSIDFGGRRVIVRVHRIEATETPHVANTPWEKVDDVIVVSPDMRQRVLTAAPEIAYTSRLHLVCNGVDTERFAPSSGHDPFRVGWCGLMTLRKNPTLALQVLAKAREADARYHLSLCGMGGESLANETFMHLARRLGLLDAIQWEGRIALAAMPAWHAANSVLLHTSLHEGLSYAVLEAAASGCDLVVFDHPGAAACWPAAVLFGTVDEAVSLIRAARPGRWREHVCGGFSLQRQIGALAAMLNDPRTAGIDATLD
jgi:glycosyltransferase involved in cell wall biosynthesis